MTTTNKRVPNKRNSRTNKIDGAKVYFANMAKEYQPLPDDTKETCDVADSGWVRAGEAEDGMCPDRCGRKAAFMRQGRCDCGMCDTTSRHCRRHQEDFANGVAWNHRGDGSRSRSPAADELN